MKKTITFLILYLASVATYAQVEGCDGIRYIADIFDNINKTTVQYGQNTNADGVLKTLSMDIYQPDGDNISQRPLIVWIHGGSYLEGLGNRTNMEDLCMSYAKKGYVTATIDYRLWNFFTGGFPDSTDILSVVTMSVGDAKAAVRYFHKDAATDNLFKIDTNYVFLGGYSAGAITALHAADLDYSDPIPDNILNVIESSGGLEGTSGNPGYGFDIKAVINLSGGLHRFDWLDANDPPFISMHGDTDETVPYLHGIANGIISIDGSGIVNPYADSINVDNYLVTVPGGGHTDIYADAAFASYREEFFTNGTLFLHDILCPGTAPVPSKDIENIALTIAPNPTYQSTFLTFSDGDYRISVFDSIGRLVQQNEVNGSFWEMRANSGVYWVRLEATGKKTITKMVVFN